MDSENSIAFVVNPNSGGGRTGKNWDKMYARILKQLRADSGYQLADGIGAGYRITQDLMLEGYNTIVPVGGEGTVNEVVNAVMNYKNSKATKVGFIVAGTVNDYQRVMGWPKTLEDQVKLIEEGTIRTTHLTKTTADEVRYALNLAGTGIGSKMAYEASVLRKLLWLKGSLRYNVMAVKHIIKWANLPVSIKADDSQIEGDLSLFTAGFSTQVGDFKTQPHVNPFGDKMGYLIAMNFSKLTMIKMLKVIKQGKHQGYDGINLGYAKKIQLEFEETPYFDVDGEVFSYNTRKVKIEPVYDAINIISSNGKIQNTQ